MTSSISRLKVILAHTSGFKVRQLDKTQLKEV